MRLLDTIYEKAKTIGKPATLGAAALLQGCGVGDAQMPFGTWDHEYAWHTAQGPASLLLDNNGYGKIVHQGKACTFSEFDPYATEEGMRMNEAFRWQRADGLGKRTKLENRRSAAIATCQEGLDNVLLFYGVQEGHLKSPMQIPEMQALIENGYEIEFEATATEGKFSIYFSGTPTKDTAAKPDSLPADPATPDGADVSKPGKQ